MKTLSLLCIGAPLWIGALSQAAAPDAAPTTEVAFEGTLAEGLAEIERLTAEGEVEPAIAVSEALLAPNEFTRWRRELVVDESKVLAPALELVDPLLERLGLNGYAEPLRAEVMYARGCARLAAEEREAAEEEFADARATSGPGELRLVASYNRGTVALLEGEVWRAQIPEVSGQPAPPGQTGPPAPGAAGMPPMPGLPGAGPPPPGEEAPDPLEVARAHYERAKEGLVERLRQDWRDADTRANVELVQRRLKELDEIERQREEQQQDQEQQDEQQQDQEQQDDSQQQDSEDESQQDESDQEQEQEQEQPPESEGEEPEPEEDEADEQESEETQEPEDAQPEEAQPEEAQPQEIYLTREEVQRLLDRLREHEEEAEALRTRLYQQSRRRVERDW